ncbi:hypothetical protein [Crocosphaera sp. Alani8]|uniref:hypothetical protein n=1 Tax=Crocosphaera sp. Alani8 TaxID=3038952 RepID=UPI00313E2B04
MNKKNTNNIDLDGLTAKQIEQLQAMISYFKQQNQKQVSDSVVRETNRFDSLDDIFFESDILEPFNRTMLYGKRG